MFIPRSGLDDQYYRCEFMIYDSDSLLGLHKNLCIQDRCQSYRWMQYLILRVEAGL